MVTKFLNVTCLIEQEITNMTKIRVNQFDRTTIQQIWSKIKSMLNPTNLKMLGLVCILFLVILAILKCLWSIFNKRLTRVQVNQVLLKESLVQINKNGGNVGRNPKSWLAAVNVSSV